MQETAVATYSRKLSDVARENIEGLSIAFPGFLNQAEFFSRNHLPASTWPILWNTQA